MPDQNTSEQLKHSPLPWRIDGWDIWEKSNPDTGFTGIEAMIGCRTGLAKSNLEFIITACNSYYDLTRQRDELLKQLENMLEMWDFITPAVDQYFAPKVDKTLSSAREIVSEVKNPSHEPKASK